MNRTEFHPVEILPAADDPALPGLALICDHATNIVPPGVRPLGLKPEDMERHIAWDVGARDVVLGLTRSLGAPAVLSRFSRLVIDPNRGPRDPTLVMRLYDGSIIPGNRSLDAKDVESRRLAFHAPYHHAIAAMVDDLAKVEACPVLLSIHTFTPQLAGQAPRPWHAGVLWDRDDRLVRPLLDLLNAEGDLVVGDNEPYLGSLPGDTMWTHGTERGLPHALIEIRNDLVSDARGVSEWVDRLARLLPQAMAMMMEDTR